MPSPLASPGRWVADGRGEGRAVRVSAHAEGGFLVVSTWKQGVCVGTVRLLPAEAAELVAGVAEGLAHLAAAEPVGAPAREARLAAVEARLARLEQQAQLEQARREQAAPLEPSVDPPLG